MGFLGKKSSDGIRHNRRRTIQTSDAGNAPQGAKQDKIRGKARMMREAERL